MSSLEIRTDCRLCGSTKLERCYSFEPTPLANEYLLDRNKVQELYPLNLMVCNNCNHVQLQHVVNKVTLFSNYLYASGTSSSFIQHFSSLADETTNKLLYEGKKFLEIGSNDGTLLDIFKRKHFQVLGVEPAQNLAEMCAKRDLNVINDYFSVEVSQRIKLKYGEFDVISGNNVLAHVDNLKAIFVGFKTLLSKCGVIVFEVSYFHEVINGKLFDTIYHEHLDYHTLTPLSNFLKEQKLRVFDADVVNSHGGSLRVFVCHDNAPYIGSKKLNDILAQEKGDKLIKNSISALFEEVSVLKEQLDSFLNKMIKEEKVIGAYGAPAKLTTFCYQFGLDNKKISFVIDDSKIKQGRFTPGKKIPIIPFDAVNFDELDVLIISAWNFSITLYPKVKEKMKSGSFVVVPLPELKIFEN